MQQAVREIHVSKKHRHSKIPQPVQFSGDPKTDGARITDNMVWFEQSLKYMEVTGIDKPEQHFLFFLQGKAAEWYTAVERRLTTVEGKRLSLKRLRTEFEQMWGDPTHRKTPMAARDPLYDGSYAQRAGEDLESYIQRFTTVMNDIRGMGEQDKARFFLEGLQPGIRKHSICDKDGNRLTKLKDIIKRARANQLAFGTVKAQAAALMGASTQPAATPTLTPAIKGHAAYEPARLAPIHSRKPNTFRGANPRKQAVMKQFRAVEQEKAQKAHERPANRSNGRPGDYRPRPRNRHDACSDCVEAGDRNPPPFKFCWKHNQKLRDDAGPSRYNGKRR